MKVYLLQHNDRMYDMGDEYVRGVYATKAAAQGALIEVEKHTGLFQSDGHDASCCVITDWDVKPDLLDALLAK